MTVTLRARLEGLAATLRSDRPSAAVAAATALGLVLRVVWVVVAERDPEGLFDPARYRGYARAIGEGQGMVEPLTGQPTAYFPPGYPWFLGIIDWVVTHSPLPDDVPFAAGLVQAALGAGSVVLVAVLGRRLLSPWAGAAAAALVAVMPSLVLHTGTLLSETLAIAVLLAFLVALVPPPSAGPWPTGMTARRLVGAGVLLGAVVLVRPVSVGVLGAVALGWLASGRGWRRTGRDLAVLVGVAALCVAPWTVRNLIRMDAPVVLSTNTGDNLCIGHGPGANGGFRLALECSTGTGVQDGPGPEIRSDREKIGRGLRAWRRGWRDEPHLTFRRLAITVERDDDALRAVQSYDLDPWLDPGAARLLSGLSNGAWYVVGVAGLAGAARMVWSRRGEQIIVPLTVVGLILPPLVTFGDPRFKVPAVPLLIVCAAALLPVRFRGGPQEDEARLLTSPR